MDGVQQTESERWEDSANLDRNWATASQADCHSNPADKLSCWVWQYGHEPRRGSWRSAVHDIASAGDCCSCFYQLRQLKSVESSLWLERLSILLYRLLFTVGLTTATPHWLEWPKFIFSNFSLCRTWLLVWCLECAEVNTSTQFLKIVGYFLVSE